MTLRVEVKITRKRAGDEEMRAKRTERELQLQSQLELAVSRNYRMTTEQQRGKAPKSIAQGEATRNPLKQKGNSSKL